jgi:hypothetical protein
MSGFDDRKRGEEGKFAHDAEFRFKATARRDKLLGLWVAETFLNLSGEPADAFAKEVVVSNFERPGDEDVVEFVLGRVAGTDSDLSDHRLRNKMEELMLVAQDQIQTEA